MVSNRYLRVFLMFLILALFSLLVGAARKNKDRDSEPKTQKPSRQQVKEEDLETIEDVDEDKIDELIEDFDKNVLVVFYEGRGRCSGCDEALRVLEEIDDNLEETGYIEVVKTDDRNVARELGVRTYPAMVYVRRRNPIFYDGDFQDSGTVLRWIRSHEEVVTVDLDDDDFEDKTHSASPAEGALDWFVMFYDSKNEECNSYIGVWETAGHRLRGLVNIGKVDISDSDDVAERFSMHDEEECPNFLLMHRGKMHRYRDSARDVRSFTSFALHRYKDQRGHRVPDPPTMLEEIYEEAKEGLQKLAKERQSVVVIVSAVAGAVILLGTTIFGCRAYRNRKSKKDM